MTQVDHAFFHFSPFFHSVEHVTIIIEMIMIKMFSLYIITKRLIKNLTTKLAATKPTPYYLYIYFFPFSFSQKNRSQLQRILIEW